MWPDFILPEPLLIAQLNPEQTRAFYRIASRGKNSGWRIARGEVWPKGWRVDEDFDRLAFELEALGFIKIEELRIDGRYRTFYTIAGCSAPQQRGPTISASS